MRLGTMGLNALPSAPDLMGDKVSKILILVFIILIAVTVNQVSLVTKLISKVAENIRAIVSLLCLR
jgi:hypothetical protein